MSNLFEQATRFKIRFTFKGLLSTEDLWDLSLDNLNTIAVDLYNQIQQTQISFISEKSTSENVSNLKLEIVKYIIEVKLAEKDAVKVRLEKLAKKQQLLELLDQKQNEQLSELSIEEIQQQLQDL